MKRVRDAVPAVEGVTCGDVYANIEAAIAHVVAALHGAACASCLHALCSQRSAASRARALRRAGRCGCTELWRSAWLNANATPGFSQGANLATIVAAHLYALGSPADAKGALGKLFCAAAGLI